MRPIPDRLTPLECWPVHMTRQDKTRHNRRVFIRSTDSDTSSAHSSISHRRLSPSSDVGGGWRTGCGSHPTRAERVEELEESVWSVVRQENEREDQGEGVQNSGKM